MKYDWVAVERQLRKELTDDRYRHTLGVTYTACALAMCYGMDVSQARMAGLLHDCAKCIPNKKKLNICEKKGIELSDFEKANPFLIHAKLGAYLAANSYKIEDEEIISAIRWHTTGKPDMSMLEKIIYIADYIEPNRFKAPRLDEIRKAAFTDIDYCMFLITQDSVNYLKENPTSMDEMTQFAYNYYKVLMENRRHDD